jgi:hypothetical protein
VGCLVEDGAVVVVFFGPWHSGFLHNQVAVMTGCRSPSVSIVLRTPILTATGPFLERNFLAFVNPMGARRRLPHIFFTANLASLEDVAVKISGQSASQETLL